MKRILSLFLTLCMLLTCASFSAVANEQTPVVYGQEAFKLLSALEIMVGDENGNPKLEENMTRAEFAQLLQNILTYTEVEEEFAEGENGSNAFFGDDSEFDGSFDVTTNFVEPVQRFTDVFDTHWAYDAILFAESTGHMTGTSATTFTPDRQVRTDEVTKVLMSILGYSDLAEVDGGYPIGYRKHAQRLKLFKNVASDSEYITRGGIAQMLVNALDINVLQISGVSKGEGTGINYDSEVGKTFATEILGISKVTGLMTDNGYASIIAESNYAGKNIVVDGVLLNVAKDEEYSAYLGHVVDCYYKNNNTDALGEVLYVAISEKENSTYISSENLDSHSNENVIYYEENGSKKQINIDGAYIIKNGAALSSYDSSLFDFDFGSVEVIETNSAKYKKIVNIRAYESWYIKAINAKEGIVYNALRAGQNASEEDIVDLNLEDEGYTYKVSFADGSPATLDAIVKGSVVDVLRNATGRVTEFVISTATVADYFIQSTEEIKGSLVYSDGEKSFKTTKSFERYIKNQNLDEIKIGSYYTIALNSNNEIAWVAKQENSDITLGYMIESGKEKASSVRDSKYVAKLYNVVGQVELYDYAEKVTVSNNQGKVEKMELDAFVEHKNKYIEYTGIFRFGTDDDGKINYVEYPITDSAYYTDGKLQHIYTARGTEDNTGRVVAGNVDGKFLVTKSGTQVISYNVDEEVEEEAFRTATTSAITSSSEGGSEAKYLKFDLYTDVKGSPMAKYVIHYTDKGEVTLDLSVHPDMFIAKKIYAGMYPNENTGYIIDAVKVNKATQEAVSLYMANDDVFTNISTMNQEKIVDDKGTPDDTKDDTSTWEYTAFNGKVQPGDIFFVELDGDGYVEKIRMFWDEDGVIAAGQQLSNGVVAEEGRATQGVFPDMLPYFVTFSAEQEKTGDNYGRNPFQIDTGRNASKKSIHKQHAGYTGYPFRTINGFALKMFDTALILTSVDIPAIGEHDGVISTGGKWWTEPQIVGNVAVIDINEENEVSVKKGAADDIRTFEDYGPEFCSRVIVITRSATVQNMFVINGYTSAN